MKPTLSYSLPVPPNLGLQRGYFTDYRIVDYGNGRSGLHAVRLMDVTEQSKYHPARPISHSPKPIIVINTSQLFDVRDMLMRKKLRHFGVMDTGVLGGPLSKKEAERRPLPIDYNELSVFDWTKSTEQDEKGWDFHLVMRNGNPAAGEPERCFGLYIVKKYGDQLFRPQEPMLAATTRRELNVLYLELVNALHKPWIARSSFPRYTPIRPNSLQRGQLHTLAPL